MKLTFNGQTMDATPEMVAGLKAAGWVEVTTSNGATAPNVTPNRLVDIDAATKAAFKKNRDVNAELAIGGVPSTITAKHAALLANVVPDQEDVLESGVCTLNKAVKKLKRGCSKNSTNEADYYFALRVSYTIDGASYETTALAPRDMSDLPDAGSILNYRIVTRFESQSKTSFNLI